MNWLAHLFLAEPTPAARVGSVLPDLVRVGALLDLTPELRRGVELHYRVDAFTDSHPVVRQSIRRFEPPFRKFGGILTDVFYDHFLARDWQSFSDTPLPEFVAEIYASFGNQRMAIPTDAYERLEAIEAGDLLSSYRELGGIAQALSRIGCRLRRPFDLAAALPVFERHYAGFHSDFAVFFPQLIEQVQGEPKAGL